MRFEIGKQAVCIANVRWDEGFGPKKNEIVTVSNFGFFRRNRQGKPLKNKWWIAFKEYDDGFGNAYCAKYFRPVVDISELTEILNAELIEP